jgi:hypothetical protein
VLAGVRLVYSNITIQPPDFIFKEPRWPISWTDEEREEYFNFARHAISFSVLSALEARKAHNLPFNDPDRKMPPASVNSGLSNIAARTARLNPHWTVTEDPNNKANKRGVKRITPEAERPTLDNKDKDKDLKNDDWLDRARVFQTAVRGLTKDYGLVDLAINDLTLKTVRSVCRAKCFHTIIRRRKKQIIANGRAAVMSAVCLARDIL